MVKFEGKYEVVKSENFAKYLTTLGAHIKEDYAKQIESAKSTVTVTVDGKKYIFASTYGDINRTSVFDTEKAFTEEVMTGVTAQGEAAVEGNTLLVRSNDKDIRTADRIYEFSDDGFTVTYKASDSDLVAKRTYKRV